MTAFAFTTLVTLLVGQPDEGKPKTPVEQLQAIKRDYEQIFQEYSRARAGAKSDMEIEKATRIRRTRTRPLLRQALALARENPRDPVAYAAPEWVVNSGLVDFPEVALALDLLLKDHIVNKNLGLVCQRALVYRYLYVRTEELLRAAIDKNRDHQVQGIACFTLARVLQDYARQAKLLKDPAKGTLGLPSDLAKRLRVSDPEKLTYEAAALYKTSIEKYADVRLAYSKSGNVTVKQLAEAALFEMHSLQVGQLGPDINAEDVDGKKLRLSDYRGNVVLLVFWATWCQPCMAMVPHERELTKRLERKRFVLLAVNGDEDRAKARRTMQEKGMTWRSWWNGGPEGPIALQWNVGAWPAVYVLDVRGVIRYKGVEGEKLDAAVDALLKEMDPPQSPSRDS